MTLRNRILELASRGTLASRALYNGLISESREAIDAAVKSLREEGRLVVEQGDFRCAGVSFSRAGRPARSAPTKIRASANLGDPLTLREVEIADLAAAGRTAKEIAAVLGVTRKTIEGALSHVYAKLGCQGRSDLAQRLQEREGQP